MNVPEKFSVETSPTFEDTAGNPLHFWLAIVALPLSLMYPSLLKRKQFILYGVATIGAFFTFCLLIKWQIWHSRLHLPVFVILCPVLAVLLSKATRITKVLPSGILLLFLVAAIPALFYNESRPFMGDRAIFSTDRTTQYFTARFSIEDEYRQLAQLATANHCREIGLIMRPDAWEYPLWILLQQQARSPLRIEHLQVQNPSQIAYRSPQYRPFTPCAVITIGIPFVPTRMIDQRRFTSQWRATEAAERFQLFLPSNRRSSS